MLEVGWSFILWSMLYLEDWSSRSSYFIGAALFYTFSYIGVPYIDQYHSLLPISQPSKIGLVYSKTLIVKTST